MTKIERNFAIIFNQRIDRPENMVPGDWLAMWDRFENPVDYQEAFDAGVESVTNDLESDISELETQNEELRSEVRMLENEIDNLEMEVERLGGTVE